MTSPRYRCRVCQNEKSDGEQWFLLIGNDWGDRLQILPWSEGSAMNEGMHAACSPSHVQQLVTHWMATGGLNHPFAPRPATTGARPRFAEGLAEPVSSLTFERKQALGELAIDRASLTQSLMENPESLVPVLDALTNALDEGRMTRKAPHTARAEEPSKSELVLMDFKQSA
jgi:hypothetical protein